ncbi:MAG: flagellar protein [Lachnospiraceae bacterium]|nr:flagellar protein [Lachnospiraceae bacterium]
MEIVMCKNCGKLFNHISGERICPACQKEIEQKFFEVKKYVRENPDIGIQALSKEMDVSVAQIKRWIREERLIFSPDSPVGIPCESCGKTIKTGRYCEACKATLANEIQNVSAVNKPKPQPSIKRSTENKMRFLDN